MRYILVVTNPIQLLYITFCCWTVLVKGPVKGIPVMLMASTAQKQVMMLFQSQYFKDWS